MCCVCSEVIISKMRHTRHQIFELNCQLHEEQLVTKAERHQLATLNEETDALRSRLFQLSWISRQLHFDLGRLSDPSFQPDTACARAQQLENRVEVVDSHKRISHHESTLSVLLEYMTNRPRVVAALLHQGVNFEGSSVELRRALSPTRPQSTLQAIVEMTYTSLYGSCVLPSDERRVLAVLRYLISFELVPIDNPRIKLRRSSCAFSQLYKLFSEGLHQAKLFLAAVLHDPIVYLLSQDELFLDIDPSKIAHRFLPAERVRRFGADANSPQYAENVTKMRKAIVAKLVALSNRFIASLRQNVSLFPPTLGWLVRRLCEELAQGGKVSKEDAVLLCTDLIFTYFICPAVTNPEPLGIIADVPISYIAGFNLMQVGQILQTLAVCRYETIDNKLEDLYSQFDQTAMTAFVDAILAPNDSGISIDQLYSTAANDDLDLQRSVVLIQLPELNDLVSYLKTICEQSAFIEEAGEDTSELTVNLLRLPDQLGSVPTATTPGQQELPPIEVLSVPIGASPSPVGMLPEQQVMSRARRLVNKSRDLQFVATPGEAGAVDNGQTSGTSGGKSKQVTKRTRFSLSHDLESVVTNVSNHSSAGAAAEDLSDADEEDDVEEDRQSTESESSSASLASLRAEEASQADEDLEGMEPPGDCLSDVVSANVSGRGSPSIASGRETPLSLSMQPEPEQAPPPNIPSVAVQAPAAQPEAEVLSQNSGIAAESRPPLNVPDTVQREGGADIQERFGKFEIPRRRPRLGDEAHSLISDSWSTDVLPSEHDFAAEQAQLPDGQGSGQDSMAQARLDLIAEGRAVGNRGARGAPRNALDVSLVLEDRSETWSVDALASDSEAGGKGDQDLDSEIASQPEIPQPTSGASSIVAAPTAPKPSAEPKGNSAAHATTDEGTAAPQQSANGAATSSKPGVCRESSNSSFYSRSDSETGGPNQTKTKADEDTERPLRREERLPSQSLGRLSGVLNPNDTPDEEKSKQAPALKLISNTPVSASKHLQRFETKLRKEFNKVIDAGDGLLSIDREGNRITNFKLSHLKRRPVRKSQTDGDLSGGTSAQSPSGVIPSPSVDLLATPNGEDITESSDDILAKYRSPGPASSGAVTPPVTPEPPPADEKQALPEDSRPYLDQENLTTCRAFLDAKRKLRMVLSSADVRSAFPAACADADIPSLPGEAAETEISIYLRLLLSNAIECQNKSLGAHLREALRCVAMFDRRALRKLLRSLQSEHRRRSIYVSYLQQSRYALLKRRDYLNSLISRIKRQQALTGECLVRVLTRFWCDKYEAQLQKFLIDFRNLSAMDEKTDLVERFLMTMCEKLKTDTMFQRASKSQVERAHLCIERYVISQVYIEALYPNGDADVSRDQVMTEHMKRLSGTLRVDHPSLRIPAEYHAECPWPIAQAEIALISAYKTPSDKLRCIERCCQAIVDLLVLGRPTGAVAADDLFPVLIYVLIAAAPPALLSSVQYVQTLGRRLIASDQTSFYWTMFEAAVKQIRTMN